LLLIALPSCTAVDIVRILATLRQALVGLVISAHGEQETDAPWRFTAIQLTFRVRGRNLQPETVRRAVEPAESKCCLAAARPAPTDEDQRRCRDRSRPGLTPVGRG
jgi:putative redox protein